MTKTTQFIFLLALFVAGFSSCNIYSLPVNSFKNQFTKTNYRIDSINCIDKKGNSIVFKNSPSLEIHITDLNDEKFIFNTQSVRINNDTVIGFKFVNDPDAFSTMPLQSSYGSYKKRIPVAAISKISIVKW